MRPGRRPSGGAVRDGSGDRRSDNRIREWLQWFTDNELGVRDPFIRCEVRREVCTMRELRVKKRSFG